MKAYELYLHETEGPCTFLDNSLDGLVEELKNSDIGTSWKVKVVDKTQDEIDELPEFDGW